MRSPLLGLQGALYSLLSASLTVYDRVPQDAEFPYVTIGHDTTIDWSAKNMSGQEVTTTVHTWSQYAGKKECKETMDAVLQAVTNAAITISDFNIVSCALDFSQVLEESDGITCHGIQRFRFKIEEV